MNSPAPADTATAVLDPHSAPARRRAAAKIRVNDSAIPLGQRLIQAGLLTIEELEAALKEQTTKKLKLGEALIELGFIDEADLLPFLQKQLAVPAVQLRDGLIDPAIVGLLPRPK